METSRIDLEYLRKDFPMLERHTNEKPLIYLDSAATAQKPQIVIDRISDFYTRHYSTVHRAVYGLCTYATERYHQTREALRKFMGARSHSEIIFTRGTTESINMVAYSFGKALIRPGDEILISEIEHHSNIVPWQILCEDRGARLRTFACLESGELDLDSFKNSLSERTKLVSVAHVSNVLGTIHPVKEMIRIAREAGAKVLIDGAQAAPHLPVDVQDLDADFYVFSGHKLYGPTGIGVLYGKEELLDLLPPYQGGGDMINQVTFDRTTYQSLPLKFEAGTPMIAEVLGLQAALEYVTSVGLDVISQWEHFLLEYATQRLLEIEGVRLLGQAKQKGAIISFNVDHIHPLDLGTWLDLNGIAVRTGHHCAQPLMARFGINGAVRISFGLYNTKKEIDEFIKSLKTAITTLR